MNIWQTHSTPVYVSAGHGAQDVSALSFGEGLRTKGTVMISGLSRATIFVSDLDFAREFYTNTLGFKEKSFFIKGGPSQSVQVTPVGADSIIYLKESGERDNGAKSRVRPRGMQAGTIWSATLALRTDDLIAECQRLRERGVRFVMDPQFCDLQPAVSEEKQRQKRRLICAAFIDQDKNVIVLEQQLEAGDPGPIELERALGE